MADGGIYEILNLVNGKRYVGSAVNFTHRWRTHRRFLDRGCHHNRYLQFAWTKYGAEAFAFRMLLECERAKLIENEQRAIDAMKPEYNLSPTAGSTLGVRFSPEARARISAANKGKMKGFKRDPEASAKTAAAHRGMKRSDETRARIAAALTGKKRAPRSDAHRQRLSEANKGKEKSPEQMRALQAARAAYQFTEQDRISRSEGMKRAYEEGRRNRERSPEYREKIAAGLRGRKATDEQRANQSAAQRGKKRGPYNTKRAAGLDQI